MKRAAVSILYSAIITGLISCSKEQKIPEHALQSKTLLNLSYGPDPLQKADVYLPANRSYETPVIFLIHGGGFYSGDKSDFSSHSEYLADNGFAVVNLNYRLIDSAGANGNPPARRESSIKIGQQLADIKIMMDFADRQADSWIVSGKKWGMTGHSAGGTLALLYSYGQYNSTGRIKVAGNWAGVTDFSFPDESYAQTVSPFVLEMLIRGVGSPVKNENLADFMAVSPYWVLKERAGVPTINVRPEFNVLSGTPDVSRIQYAAFSQLLDSKIISNQYIELPGADHSFTKPGDWQLVLKKTVEFFRTELP